MLAARELVRITVQDCSPDDVPPAGIAYELTGESCVPGLETGSPEAIFEEQAVVPRLDPFGTPQPRGVYAAHEQVFLFGPVLATQRVVQRFRLTNPFKVPCEVAVAVRDKAAALAIAATPPPAVPGAAGAVATPPAGPTPRAAGKGAAGTGAQAAKGGASAVAAGAGGGDEAGAESGASAFEVTPARLVIPPREHRFVEVAFAPPAMRAYEGVFQALVEDGPDPRTRILQFDVRGEGVLPHVTVVEPRVADPAATTVPAGSAGLCDSAAGGLQSLSAACRPPGNSGSGRALPQCRNGLCARALIKGKCREDGERRQAYYRTVRCWNTCNAPHKKGHTSHTIETGVGQ